MMGHDELWATVREAQARIGEAAGELRRAGEVMTSVTSLTTWRSEAAERFRVDARDLVVALHAAAARAEGDAEALGAAAHTIMVPAG